jgi:endonuclease/exonuclease/phosphatase family metal-dependent hydrolase
MRVRVVTLNVLNLEGDPRRQEVINAELRRLAPDVVSLQEVIKEDGRDQLALLLEGTGLRGTHQADLLAYHPPGAERYGGNAVASRWPHSVVETLDIRVDRAGVPHPWVALASAVEVPGEGEMLFIATTMCPRYDGEGARERQVVDITDLDARHRRPLPTVLAGDFNVGPRGASVRYLTGLQSLSGQSVHYHDAWAVAGEGVGNTISMDNPLAAMELERLLRQPNQNDRIDYVFVGSVEAHPHARATIQGAALAFNEPHDGVWASDHFGLVVDLDVGVVPQQPGDDH